MTNEEKDLKTSEDNTNTTEDVQDDPTGQDESESETKSPNDTSYYEQELARLKAENEKLASDRDNYRTAALLAKQKKKSSDSENKEDNEKADIASIAEQLREEQRKEFEKLRMDSVRNMIDDAISSVSNDPKERELIKYYYDKKIVKTGFTRSEIQNDIEDAKFMANKKKLLATNKELEMAIGRKSATSQANLSSKPLTTESNDIEKLDSSTARFVQGLRSTRFYPKKN